MSRLGSALSSASISSASLPALLLPVLLLACAPGDANTDEDDDGGAAVDSGAVPGDTGSTDSGSTSDDGGTDSGSTGDDGGTDSGSTGDDGGTDSGGDGGDDTGTGPVETLPVEGTWAVDRVTVTDDPCGLTDFRGPEDFAPERFDVAHDGATAFTLTGPDGAPTACDVADGAYACETVSVTEAVGFGIDASLVIDTALSGDILAVDDLTMALSVGAECTGDGCFLLELAGLSFPCALTGDLDLVAP